MAEEIPKKKKLHRWRMCPAGEHWVSTHPRNVPVSKKNPKGTTIVDEYCRANPSKKDQIYPDEIRKIARRRFRRLKKLPTPDKLDVATGNKYDRLIAGWTKYWNEVLKPEVRLDPNLVKALIRTESTFDEEALVKLSKTNWVRGLMQVTDQSIEILKNEKGELKDFLINIDEKEAFDPTLNIFAGIRWLFHKKYLLEHKLKRTATWEEAVMEYKSFTKGLVKGDEVAIRERDKFLGFYKRLKK